MLNIGARGRATFLAVALIGWLLPAQMVSGATVNFSAIINGPQEPTPSLAVWNGTFVMDTDANTLAITVTDSLVAPLSTPEIAAHIHGFAGPGVPAGILFGLPLGSPKNAVWNFAEGQQANIIAGLTYVNIHTTMFPAGEIRGQVLRVPGCGDGILDGGETCDDGNTDNGDCCSSICQTDPDGTACGAFGGTCEAGACAGVNHYLCHQVKDLKVPAKFVPLLGTSIIDQTGNFTCEVKKPKFLCNPANKNGSGIEDPNLHYCCYQVKCVPKKVAASYDITDQFGNLRLETKKPKFLCNPCDKAPAP